MHLFLWFDRHLVFLPWYFTRENAMFTVCHTEMQRRGCISNTCQCRMVLHSPGMRASQSMHADDLQTQTR